MFSHVTIGTNDFDRAIKFYDAVLGTLGHERFYTGDGYAGYGAPNDNQVWVMHPYDGNRATAGNGTHIAFLAPDRESVRRFHAAALANGGSDEGGPGQRPHYHPNYYGAYVRDPEGIKLQAVCHRPAD
ncbi:MAG: VOC family protein [Alphaproteobacteria bacterium]|jgi:catechol 2,3-dioxygenase-like lactoylglutathione lyase family enzyme|nr:VOC family protein [Alphaproteobacteria bacterium]